VGYGKYRVLLLFGGNNLCAQRPARRAISAASAELLVTSEQHLLQEVVDLDGAAVHRDLDELDQLARDAVKRRQQQQYLAEPTARLVLAVAHVVVEVQVDLVADRLDLGRVTHAANVYTSPRCS